MSLLDRLSVVGAKVESVVGTAVVPGASDCAFVSYNWKLNRNVAVNERPSGNGFGQLSSVHGPRMATAEFETDFTHSGADNTAPFWQSVLAVCCGLSLSTDVLTCTTTGSTATIVCYKNGVREGIAGAVGTGVITLNSGGPCRIKWTFTGKLLDDADIALPTVTYPTLSAPRFAGNTVTVHSVTPQISTATLDFGNEVVLREDPADATGYVAAIVVDRKPTITLDPEAVTIATKDWQSIMQAHTEGSISIGCGNGAGNVMTISSSTAQVIDPSLGARNKLVTRELKFQLNGISPFTITGT